MKAKRTIPALAGTLVALGAYAGDAVAPKVGAPVKLKDGSDPLDVTVGHAAPLVVDWDKDGKKDLLVGQFGDGKLRVYLNKGTDKEPKLEGFSFVQAGGKDATVPVG